MTQNIWGFPSNQSTTFNEALGYKKYVALLTQTGTDNPVATVLENTLGSDINWIRSTTGVYHSDYIFSDPSKVFLSLTGNYTGQGPTSMIALVSGEVYDDGLGYQLWFATQDYSFNFSDNWGTYISVEIRVYP